MCLGNISKNFTAKKNEKTESNRYVYHFFVDYKIIDTGNFINIQKYLMKKYGVKLNQCMQLFKKCLLYYQLA